ncbi:MAG: prepilin-type N-terminal cleavage/methylation domain-containing protein [Verrucomicrobiota bacterium]
MRITKSISGWRSLVLRDGEVRLVIAFTLIEMLVTMAVIAILASLLFPALAGAKKRSQQVTCGNQVRQILLAMVMYADDNRGAFPRMALQNGSEWVMGNWAWDVPKLTMTQLMSYGASRPVFNCPSQKLLWTDEAWNYSTNYRVISYAIATAGCPGIDSTNAFHSASQTAELGTNGMILSDHTYDPSYSTLVSDAVISMSYDPKTMRGSRFSGIPGGWRVRGQVVMHHSSHMEGTIPKYYNAGYLDGHAEKRNKNDARMRSSRYPYFWW